MSYRDDERRWKRIQDLLAAEAAGKELRPTVSQRTLFGIPSAMEQTIARAVAEDEEERRMKRERTARRQRVAHPIDPVYDERSRVLLLGTMPSPKSRESGFYYGHPQNRFWRVLSDLFGEPLATTNERRRDQLLRHHIAMWDVLASCDIAGASDASLANVVPNDLGRIFAAAPIEAVFCTGAKAADLYERLCRGSVGMPCTKLPSTSPANASAKLPDLVEAYAAILPHLHERAPYVLDVPDVVAAEQALAAGGTSLAELMDRAGLALAHRIHRKFPRACVAVLCGNGNNGGDGWVAARVLAGWGHDVSIATLRMPDDLKAQPARDTALAALPELDRGGVRVIADPGEAELGRMLSAADVVVDAILGTGFSGSRVKAPFDRWIRQANGRREAGAFVISADVPSGLNAQTGTASEPCVAAGETLTMIVSKPGLHVPAASAFCGEVRVAPLAYVEPLLDGAPQAR